MVNCTDLLSEKIIEASSDDGKTKFGYDEGTFCLNPNNARTSKFWDSIGNGPERLVLMFEECRYIINNADPNVNCMTKEESDEYITNGVAFSLYESKTMVDF